MNKFLINLLLDFFDLQRFDVLMVRHFGKKVKSVRRFGSRGYRISNEVYFFNRSAGADGNRKKIMINLGKLFISFHYTITI